MKNSILYYWFMFIDSAYVIPKCTPSTSDLHCLIIFNSVLTNDVLGICIYCSGGTEHLSCTPDSHSASAVRPVLGFDKKTLSGVSKEHS